MEKNSDILYFDRYIDYASDLLKNTNDKYKSVLDEYRLKNINGANKYYLLSDVNRFINFIEEYESIKIHMYSDWFKYIRN